MALRRRAIRAIRGRAVPVTARTEPSKRADDGFTLIELLVVSIILPLVVAALSLGIVAVFSQQSQLTGRLGGSTDLQMVAATFIRDVESASTLTNQSSPQVCGSTGTQLLGLTWSGGQTNVSYVEVLGNGSGSLGFNAQLQRLYCVNGSTTPSSVTVVSNGAAATAQQPTQPAPTICIGNVPASGPCTTPSSYPVSATAVTQVSFPVYVPPNNTPYVMVASPRQGAGGNLTGGPNSSAPILLTSTNCGNVLTVNNNGQLWINVDGGTGNGSLTVESPCAGKAAVSNSTGNSDNGNGRGSVCVSAIITGSQPVGTFTNPALKPIPSDPKYDNNLPCYGFSPPTPIWYYSDNFVNPLANLVAPPTPSTPQGVCQVSKSFQARYTCSPGEYGSTSNANPTFSGPQTTFSYPPGALPAFPNNAVVDFTPGAYRFDVPVSLPNGITATFELGTYAFMKADGAGDSFAAPSNSRNASITGNNVLFYAPSGNISFGNNIAVSLTANPDPNYHGVTVWDGPPLSGQPPRCPPSSPTYTMTLANNGSDTYGGIYAPCAELMTKQNGTLDSSFIVASSAQFSQNTVINVTSP